MDSFENHPFTFPNLDNHKNRLPNGYPEMVIGGCVSPSPNAVQQTALVEPTTGSGPLPVLQAGFYRTAP